MNAILGYAQILERDRTLTQAQAHGVKTIERSGDHLLALIDDVLSLAKIEAGKLGITQAEFKLPTLLQNILDISRLRAEQKGIEFRYKPSRQLPIAIHGDERAICQVLLNLIGNAIKFTEQGSVTLRVEYIADESSMARLRFVVEDTGIGMPADRLERIFEPFHQIEQAGRADDGTGLGLAISQNLAGLMGGQISVESTPGVGSVFSFELALPLQGTSYLVTDDKYIVGYEGKRRRVLIADDTAENREILIGLLAPLGFDLVEVENGSAAVQKNAEFQPHVVLMDLVMPVMDGFEATRTIQNAAGTKPPVIIALSASVLESDQMESAHAGCDDFIPKPVQAPVLLEKLRWHLGLDWIYEAGTISTQTPRCPAISKHRRCTTCSRYSSSPKWETFKAYIESSKQSRTATNHYCPLSKR